MATGIYPRILPRLTATRVSSYSEEGRTQELQDLTALPPEEERVCAVESSAQNVTGQISHDEEGQRRQGHKSQVSPRMSNP